MLELATLTPVYLPTCLSLFCPIITSCAGCRCDMLFALLPLVSVYENSRTVIFKNSSMTSFLKPCLIFLSVLVSFMSCSHGLFQILAFPFDPGFNSTFSSIVHLLLCYECKNSPETFITYSQSETEITLENDGAEATSCHHTHRTVPTKRLLLWNSLWYEFGTCIS